MHLLHHVSLFSQFSSPWMKTFKSLPLLSQTSSSRYTLPLFPALEDICFHMFPFILFWRLLLQLEGLRLFLDPHHCCFFSVLNISIWLLILTWKCPLSSSSSSFFLSPHTLDGACFPFLVCFPSPFENDSFQHSLSKASLNHICLSIFLFFFLSFACLVTQFQQFWSFYLHLSIQPVSIRSEIKTSNTQQDPLITDAKNGAARTGFSTVQSSQVAVDI